MILQDMSQAELIAAFQASQAENARLKACRGNGKLTLKVSAKGAVSVYGMGKWPVTLYKTQWERLLQHSAEITAYINANADLLATKDAQ